MFFFQRFILLLLPIMNISIFKKLHLLKVLPHAHRVISCKSLRNLKFDFIENLNLTSH